MWFELFFLGYVIVNLIFLRVIVKRLEVYREIFKELNGPLTNKYLSDTSSTE